MIQENYKGKNLVLSQASVTFNILSVISSVIIVNLLYIHLQLVNKDYGCFHKTSTHVFL